MINFILLFSRQGKLRLQKWYEAKEMEEAPLCAPLNMTLFFCFAVDRGDNELGVLEVIHRYVEVLDKYFGSVCELDIIFNFEKAYFILDELILGGEMQVRTWYHH